MEEVIAKARGAQRQGPITRARDQAQPVGASSRMEEEQPMQGPGRGNGSQPLKRKGDDNDIPTSLSPIAERQPSAPPITVLQINPRTRRAKAAAATTAKPKSRQAPHPVLPADEGTEDDDEPGGDYGEGEIEDKGDSSPVVRHRQPKPLSKGMAKKPRKR